MRFTIYDGNGPAEGKLFAQCIEQNEDSGETYTRTYEITDSAEDAFLRNLGARFESTMASDEILMAKRNVASMEKAQREKEAEQRRIEKLKAEAAAAEALLAGSRS